MAYFVVGGIFMYTKRGARGVEVIPNYTFWKDLPFLLKVKTMIIIVPIFSQLHRSFFQDGFFFTISPCYRRRDSYSGLS